MQVGDSVIWGLPGAVDPNELYQSRAGAAQHYRRFQAIIHARLDPRMMQKLHPELTILFR